MVSAWHRFFAWWRDYRELLGFPDTLALVAATALSRGTGRFCRFIRYRIVAQPVPENNMVAAHRKSRLQVRRLEPDAPALDQFPRERETFENRFTQGAIVYAVFDGDRPVGFIWFVMGPYHEDEVNCEFQPHPEGEVAWDFDVYVVPEYRVTTAFLRLWDAAYLHMRTAGVRWSMSRISAFNPVSLAVHRKLGAVDCGTLNFVCIGRMQIAVGSFPPKLRISYASYGKPRYRVSPVAISIS